MIPCNRRMPQQPVRGVGGAREKLATVEGVTEGVKVGGVMSLRNEEVISAGALSVNVLGVIKTSAQTGVRRKRTMLGSRINRMDFRKSIPVMIPVMTPGRM